MNKAIISIVAFLIIGLGGLGYYYIEYGTLPGLENLTEEEETAKQILSKVEKGPLTIMVNENGSTIARQKITLRNTVPGRVMIVNLIDDGEKVKKGDLLAELDSTKFQDDLVERGNRKDAAEAALVTAKEELEINRSQANSDIEQAEVNLKLAELDLEKYLKGEYPRDLQKAESDITIAEEELTRAKEQLEWSTRLSKKGYVSGSDLKADELNFKRREVNLELSKTELKLLKDFTYIRRLAELRNKAKQNKAALERQRAKAKATINKSIANLKNKQSDYDRQLAKFNEIKASIAACKVYAPADGIAIHAQGGNRWGRGDPIAVGTELHQRQEIIHIPINNEMMIHAKIPEASLSKIKVGQDVSINVDAIPGETFTGYVAKIARQPDPSGWWNNYLKAYTANIHIDGSTTKLRTGMNCRVSIMVNHYDEVMYVPLQSVVLVKDHYVVYTPGEDGEPVAQEVRIGLDNNRVVAIEEGLKPGQEILLNPPLKESAAAHARRLAPEKPFKRPEDATRIKPKEQVETGLKKDTERLIRFLQGAKQGGYLDKVFKEADDLKIAESTLELWDAEKYKEIDEEKLEPIVVKFKAMMQKRKAAMQKRKQQQGQ